MLGGFVLTMPERPNVDRLTEYYAKTMMTKPMRWFCRKSGEKKFTPQSVAGLQAAAALKAADRNPYSWNMDFYEYPDGSGYEARFTKCGICVLMRELGLSPVLDAGLALGEGTGAVMMFSLLDIAMSLYETGATFGDFKIEEYHRF